MSEYTEAPIQFNKASTGDPMSDSDALQKLMHKHVSRYKAWRDWRKPYESIWGDCYAAYRNSKKASRMPTRSDVAVPTVFQGIETAVPKFLSILFGQNRFFDILPPISDSAEGQLSAQRIRRLLDVQLDKAAFYPKFVEFLKQLCIYGTSYFMTYWKVDRRTVVEKTISMVDAYSSGTFIGTKAQTKSVEVNKVVERRPELEVLPIEDVYPDPEACDVHEGVGVYVMSKISRSALKAMSEGPFPTYTNYEAVKETKGKVEENDFKRRKDSIRGVGDTTQTGSPDPDTVELLTFYGLEDLNGDGVDEECCIVVANQQVIIKAVPNKFEHKERPIVKQTLYPVTREWYGIGLVEMVVKLKAELDTIRRQNIDANNLIVNNMWKVNTLYDVDLDTLVSQPNGIILTDEMAAVERIPTQPLPVSPIDMSEMIQRDIENNMAPRSLQGSPESGALGRTAKGAQLIIGQALEKFGVSAKLIEDVTVRKILYYFTKLNKQFIDNDIALTHYRRYVPDLELADVQAEVEFLLLGVSDTIQRETTINTIISYVNVFAPLIGQQLKVVPIAKKVWDMLGISIPSSEIVDETASPLPAELAATGGGTPGSIVGQISQNGVSAPPQIGIGG